MKTSVQASTTAISAAETYTEIHGGHVRLYSDGRVRFYLPELDGWAVGFGPWAAVPTRGLDKQRLSAWIERHVWPI